MTIAYLLFDLPADHEVEEPIATECDSIRAILTNKERGKKVKVVRAATTEAFSSAAPATPYKKVRYVHVACHADPRGAALLGGHASWTRLAIYITKYLTPLHRGEQRVLCLSCCHSATGVRGMGHKLRRYFTAAYYLTESEVGFDTSMVVWSMFYYRKTLRAPIAKVADRINGFFPGRPLAIPLLQPRSQTSNSSSQA